MFYQIIADRDLQNEARGRLDPQAYRDMKGPQRKLRKTSDELAQLPHCLGGPQALAVFRSYYRDDASMYDFINIFTEYAKTLPLSQKSEVETKSGELATWIAANKRKFT